MEEELLSEEQQKEIYPHSDTLRINERHVDFGKAWEGTKRIDNKYDPIEYGAAGFAYALEGTSWFFDKITNGDVPELCRKKCSTKRLSLNRKRKYYVNGKLSRES